VHEAASRFVERLGLQVEAEGFPRIAGRMIGYLLLQDEPSSLDELAEKLQVSKASVSTNARALERLGYVERHSVPGDRRDYYMIVDEPWVQLMASIRDQFRSRVELFEDNRTALPAELEAGRRRLAAWQKYFTHLVEQVDWWCARHSAPGAGGVGDGGRGNSEEN
jgi:DNA-binding transcriptional regulator GbsR (MarR family)